MKLLFECSIPCSSSDKKGGSRENLLGPRLGGSDVFFPNFIKLLNLLISGYSYIQLTFL
jgi:hypothetical protein